MPISSRRTARRPGLRTDQSMRTPDPLAGDDDDLDIADPYSALPERDLRSAGP